MNPNHKFEPNFKHKDRSEFKLLLTLTQQTITITFFIELELEPKGVQTLTNLGFK